MKESTYVSKRKLIKICFLSCLFLLSSCNGTTSVSTSPSSSYNPSSNLKDIYRDYFDIGGAIQYQSIDSGKYEDLLPHFSSLTPENDMKWKNLEADKGVLTYENPDKIVSYARTNGKKVRGHCLLWHKSLPTWIKGECTDKKAALSLIDSHVKSTMQHFGSDVYCYDVVNEALHNSVTTYQLNQNDIYRAGSSEISGSDTMDWYSLCGVDYLKQAFSSASEAKALYGLNDTKLYYNDYSLNNPNKREACVRLVKMLQNDGIEIDGVGMQCHYRLPDYEEDKEAFLTNFEDSIKVFTSLGIDVQITELDIRLYKNSSDASMFDSLPLEYEQRQGELYGKLFEICRKYSLPWTSGAGVVNSVSTWGIADDHNAMNTSSHKEFPLIFSTNHKNKKAYYEITDF